MLKHKGTQKLETKNLILRNFNESDAEQMFDNWASDERVTKFLRWKPHQSPEESKKLCKLWEDMSKEKANYQWAIIEKETNYTIGSIGLVDTDEKMKSCEIGYCIGHNWWGKGYASEALREILKFIDDIGFVRIYAMHHVLNEKSGRVLIKNDFKYEGILKKFDVNNDGEFIDVKIYSKIK